MRRVERAALRRRLMAGLRSVAAELTNQAKQRATRHVDTGELRNSITYTERGNTVLFGLPANAKNVSLELGFRPHWVPLRYIEVWMRRHKIGFRRVTVQSIRTRRRSQRRVFAAAGLYVGGPGSTLDYGGSGASGTRMVGRRPVSGTWRTQGERSPYLQPGRVGFSVIRHTVGTRLKAISTEVFLRGYRRGR